MTRIAFVGCWVVACQSAVTPTSPRSDQIADDRSFHRDAAQPAPPLAVETVPTPALAPAPAPPAAPAQPLERWLRGSTHVHARPSGDSATPIPDVVAWYEKRNYDFIVLTDHNRVSELDATSHTSGPAVRAPASGLIVFAGSELTYNPTGCQPVLHPTRNCRIHVNLIGVTARPAGKFEWADRKARDRVDAYAAALVTQKSFGGIAQLNHPNWFWGMNVDGLVELARRGIPLVEIANMAFPQWNAGDGGRHLSTEALWDAALTRGAALWGVASDDAHAYGGREQYQAGTGWIMVKARREPQAMLDAIAAGRFYSSTGVTLERAEVESGELVIEVANPNNAAHAIDFIEAGKIVATVRGDRARHPVPPTGYVRAVVTRKDGKKAWSQPARRP